ncbi:MAG: hypothetical protein AAF901_01030 [Bacteroidota bacterium]
MITNIDTLLSKKSYTVLIRLSMKELNEDLAIVAKAVELYGNKYLPVFVRFHNEIENHKKQDSFRNIALQMAQNSIL